MVGIRLASVLRSLAAIAVGLFMAGAATPMLAQTERPSAPGGAKPRAAQEETRKNQSRAPQASRADRGKNLDFLFGALKAAPDALSARTVELRILALWQASGSDTADLLMARVKQATDAKDIDLGLQLLDAVVELQPGFAEGWNRRATLNFLKKDFGASLSDLRQVLAREPRHFGALAGLGMILQEIGEEKMALTLFRRALELHPHMPRVEEMVKSLTEKVEGRPI